MVSILNQGRPGLKSMGGLKIVFAIGEAGLLRHSLPTGLTNNVIMAIELAGPTDAVYLK